VIDARTGAGLPNVRVTVEDAAVSTTAFDGSVLFWLNVEQINRTLRVTIEHGGVQTVVEAPVARDRLAVLALWPPDADPATRP